MTYILEDQVFIIIMILYADDKSTVCCFGLVLDSFVKTGDRKVPILVGPLYHFNCRMEMSNSSNYSYDIILQFSLSAFVSLKKKSCCTVYVNRCLGFFPLRRRDVTDRNITYTHSGDPCRWCRGLPNPSIHRVQATLHALRRQSLMTQSRHIYDNFIQLIPRSVYPFYFMNVNILPIAIAFLEPCVPSLPNTSRVTDPCHRTFNKVYVKVAISFRNVNYAGFREYFNAKERTIKEQLATCL